MGLGVQHREAPTALIADHNVENCALARATLEGEGYRVRVALGGEDAIAAAAAEHFDCILMDVRLPGVDGITACERIRAQPGGDASAIVFVSAKRDVDTFDRALAAGGDDFITKPFRPADLLGRLHTALRFRRIATERTGLYAQLKHQRDQFQRLEFQKEHLVEFLVHDLKSPVNTIALNAQLLLQGAHDADRAHLLATRILNGACKLDQMILNLLDIGRADEGQLVPVVREIDAAAFFDSVLVDLTDRAAAAGVAIDSDIDIGATRLQVDPDLIARVLSNLIDNAIRHAPEGSRIQVALARHGERMELRVTDRGPGVPVALREAVFDRFRSGKTASRTNRGLGLTFCKVAVEAHGGKISIEDGHPGAVFCVSLPAVAPSVTSTFDSQPPQAWPHPPGT